MEKMTAEEFDSRAAELRDFSGLALDMARLVLVQGLGISAAAEQLGTSKQNVSQTIKRVRARLAGHPADWVRVELWMPPEMAARVKAEVAVLANGKHR